MLFDSPSNFLLSLFPMYLLLFESRDLGLRFLNLSLAVLKLCLNFCSLLHNSLKLALCLLKITRTATCSIVDCLTVQIVKFQAKILSQIHLKNLFPAFQFSSILAELSPLFL